MKYPKNREYEFDHPSGRFTGFVEHEDEQIEGGSIRPLMLVRLTSKADCNLRLRDGAFSPGEMRYIRSDTPARTTGKTRLISETQISIR